VSKVILNLGYCIDAALGRLCKFPFSSIIILVTRLFVDLPEQGSYTSLFAAAAPAVRQDSALYRGSYLAPYGKLIPASILANDEGLSKTLWLTSEQVLKDFYGL